MSERVLSVPGLPLNQSSSCGPYNAGPIPSWTSTGTAGSWQPCSSDYASLPDGTIVGFSNGGTISQTLSGTSLQPNSSYALSVYIGHRADGNVATYTVALEAGTTVLASASGTNSTIPAGQFAQVTVPYTTGSTVTPGNLSIVLTSGGTQIDFDKVQLSGPAGGTLYYHQDHLSNRLVTDASGNTVEQVGHYPFGESWYNATNDKLLFTSYERDAESGNDYAMARSYISRLG